MSKDTLMSAVLVDRRIGGLEIFNAVAFKCHPVDRRIGGLEECPLKHQ